MREGKYTFGYVSPTLKYHSRKLLTCPKIYCPQSAPFCLPPLSRALSRALSREISLSLRRKPSTFKGKGHAHPFAGCFVISFATQKPIPEKEDMSEASSAEVAAGARRNPDLPHPDLESFDYSQAAFSLPFDVPLPKMKVSRPSVADTIGLLPLASRVGSYVYKEHNAGRTPIFDLNGITLSPPIPKPYAGVPIGGIGCGNIGRGIKGEFRRWSLSPGRYRHTNVSGAHFLYNWDKDSLP